MKNKILLGIMTFVMALFVASCSDDDYAVNDKALLGDGSVVTGSADVTATSATLNGSVDGLDGQSASSYTVGFNYGDAADNLTEKVVGSSAAAFTATISGTPGSTIYYQAYVTLQGRLTYTGEVKSLVLTDAKAITGNYSDITANTVKLQGQASQYTADAEVGVLISASSEVEDVRAGVKVVGVTGDNFEAEAYGLLPNTTYYYAAYVDLGGGVVYGEVKSFTTPSQDFDLDNDLVDLGLSTKWGRYNIGASKETDLGGVFGFGDVTGYKTSIDPADYASKDIYKTTSDVVNIATNGKATLPTIDEFEELFRLCTVEWTSEDGVQGYKFTGPNGNSIFMPAAGSRTGSDFSGVGSEGHYLSGSINTTDNTFAMSYTFNNVGNSRSTTPVYQALSVRPVSVAKNVPFVKENLYNTWEIDLTTDGEYETFPGPSYFYGTDDSWRTVTNHEPIVGDSWSWEADFAGNSWAVGGSAANCQGSITFNEDGTVSVTHVTPVTDASGVTSTTEVTETGTFTVDEENKTISLQGVKLLAPANFTDDQTNNLTTDIKILSLTDKSLQFGVLRTSDNGCLLSINMIPTLEKYGYKAKLTCYGDTENTENGSDAWNSATLKIPAGDSALGTYSLTFNTTNPRYNGKVYVLDIEGFAAAYPNAFIRVDKIEADGVDVPFDANKFYYGNIEGAGNFRVEMANIWGCGHNGGWNGLQDTPFHQGGGETTNETALAFNSTFTVTFTIVSLDATLDFTVQQAAVASDWAGTWDNLGDDKVHVAVVNNQYQITNTNNITMTYNGALKNGMVCLVEVKDIMKYFPGFSAELISVVNDGVSVPFDSSKILSGDLEGSGTFRNEVYNTWGGSAKDPAFSGKTDVDGNTAIPALGCTTSTAYTIGNFSTNLFTIPW